MAVNPICLLDAELQRVINGPLIQASHKRGIGGERAWLLIKHVPRGPAGSEGTAGGVVEGSLYSCSTLSHGTPHVVVMVVVLAVYLLVKTHGVVDGALRDVAVSIACLHDVPASTSHPTPLANSMLRSAAGVFLEASRATQRFAHDSPEGWTMRGASGCRIKEWNF